MATALRFHLKLSPDAICPFDAPGVAKRLRHAAAFGALDAQNPGEAPRCVDDHEPLPLQEQLSTLYAEAVTGRKRVKNESAFPFDAMKIGNPPGNLV